MGTMQLSTEFVNHLTSLRRYARALTGSQDAGDELVVRTLERLSTGPRLRSETHPKTLIFKELTAYWNGPLGDKLRGSLSPAPVDNVADERLRELEEPPRQAFLLVAMEGFSTEEAASVLSMDQAAVSDLLHTARQQIAAQVRTSVLIIEDEVFIAAELESLMTELGHQIFATARTHEEALEITKAGNPGLVLADIKLADGSSGIDAVRDLLKRFSLPVIFITAFPDSLLTGQRPEPTFLIRKPFTSDEVRAVVSQALYFKSHASDKG